MKRGLLFIGLMIMMHTGYSQLRFALKAGGGPSWLAFPKVFLQDPVVLNNTWEIQPGTTGGHFYLGGEMITTLGEHWLFRGELSVSYISGSVNVDELLTNRQARKLQSYVRTNIPLLVTVKSTDHFWFSFGPVVYITLHDNKGFDDAVHELATAAVIDSTRPFGMGARLAGNIQLQDHLYLEVKFDYDLNKYFKYENNTYKVRMAAQGVTFGLTYVF